MKLLFGNGSDTPHYEAHRNFITGSDGSACGYVFQVPFEQRCDFVRETDDCHDMVHVVDYMTVLFCNLSGFGTIAGIVAMIIFSVYLIVILVLNAQMNFAPTLLVIAKSMHLSEYLAGVTILPLGNGLVDLITGFEKYDGDTEMWSNATMGTAMFVTAVIGGLIVVMHPFSVVPAFFILLNVFYLATLTWITAIMINETVYLWEAVGCVILYGFFVCSIVCMQLYQNSNHTVFYADINSAAYQQSTQPIKMKKHISFRDIKGMPENHQIFQEYFSFLYGAIFRVWSVLHNCHILFYIFALLPRLCLAVTVPSVNNALPTNNWCKLAIMLNMFFVPPIFLVAARVTDWKFFVAGFVMSTVAAVTIFFTTRTYQWPRFHNAFAVIGFATSIAITYFAASELMSCLCSLFTLLNIGRQTIGLAAVAWGNGLADLVVNLQVAMSGYHVMASTACYSGPILNLLIGYGITFIMRAIKADDNKSKARSGTMGFSSVICLFCFIIITMTWTMICGFQHRRSIGICMLSIYFLYLIFCLLCELSWTHGYGTDHYDESPFQV